MSWNIAQAKQQFSEVVRQAAGEPQMIYNRDRCVAAIIDAETFRQFEAWQRSRKKSLGQWFAELRQIAAEENYQLPIVPRSESERPNTFVGTLEEWEASDAEHRRAA